MGSDAQRSRPSEGDHRSGFLERPAHRGVGRHHQGSTGEPHVTMTFRRLVALFCVALSAPALAQGSGSINAPAQENKPYVVLISFDGMRPEYLQRIDLPNFARVMRRGVTAEGMIPTFPSKTFPNHYTVVTGLHAGRHGIVSN